MTIRYDRSVIAALVVIAATTPGAIAQVDALDPSEGMPLELTEIEVLADSAVTTVAGLEQSAHELDHVITPDALAASAEPVDVTAEIRSAEIRPTEAEAQPLSLNPTDEIAQRPSVRNLSDVQPTDWAFQALRNLIENYGCLDGFSDNTFRGNQPITRFEFAAGLSACLDAIVVGPDDIATVAQLQREFAAELSTRVDDLEARVAELRADQFSTTTRLFGQATFGLQVRNNNTADLFPVDGIRETSDPGGGRYHLLFQCSAEFADPVQPP
jgi:hypothetical protein